MNWIFIGVGGALGAISRFLVGQLLKPYSRLFPYATLTVNSIGSFLFGILLSSGLKDNSNLLYVFFTGGFLGAFTTFSTFSFESVTIINQKNFLKTALYIGLHLVVGLSLATLGYYIF